MVQASGFNVGPSSVWGEQLTQMLNTGSPLKVELQP